MAADHDLCVEVLLLTQQLADQGRLLSAFAERLDRAEAHNSACDSARVAALALDVERAKSGSDHTGQETRLRALEGARDGSVAVRAAWVANLQRTSIIVAICGGLAAIAKWAAGLWPRP